MVRGLELFRTRFADYADSYVLIGGAACDVLLEHAALPFRATGDIRGLCDLPGMARLTGGEKTPPHGLPFLGISRKPDSFRVCGRDSGNEWKFRRRRPRARKAARRS